MIASEHKTNLSVNKLWQLSQDYEPIFNPESPPILGFKGDYSFLSNFHVSMLTYKGICFTSSEQAYVYSKKLPTPEWLAEVLSEDRPGHIKFLGSKVKLRDNWDNFKYNIMKDIVRCKFTQSPLLTKLLLDTGDSYLEETNWWRDTYWGVCNGVGENHLGNILMQLRKEIRECLK